MSSPDQVPPDSPTVDADGPDDDVPDDGPGVETEPDSMAWGRTDWMAVGVLFLVSIMLVGLHVRAYPQLSPIDELAHVDYVIKAGDFDPPEIGERIGVEAMREAACRTLDVVDFRGPACGLDDYQPEDFGERVFREGAINTSAGQFPGYYSITGVLSRVAADVGIVESRVTAARMLGAVWAGAGWSVIWAVLGMLRIPRARRAMVIALLIVTPLTLFHTATVNADAVLILTGALVVFSTLKFVEGRFRWWWLVAAYAGLTLLEPTTALAVGACVGFLFVRVTLAADRSPWERALPLTLLVLAAFHRLVFASWLRDRITSLDGPAPGTEFASGADGMAGSGTGVESAGGDLLSLTEPFGVDWDRVLVQLGNVFSPVNRAYLPPFMRTQQTNQLIELTDWLLIAGLFAAAAGLTSILSAGRSGVARSAEVDVVAATNTLWLSRLGLITLLLAGPAYTFSYAYFSDQDFDAPGRFGLPLVVFLVIGLSSAITTRWARGAVVFVASLSALNTLWLLLTP